MKLGKWKTNNEILISKTKHTDTFSIVYDMDMEYEYDKR